MSETQAGVGRSFTEISERSGIPWRFRSLGLGVPWRAPGPALLPGRWGRLGQGHTGEIQPEHGPGCRRGGWSGPRMLFVPSGSRQSLVFLFFYGQCVTKASGQWSCGLLEMGSETNGEGSLYVFGDTRFPPAASKGLERKRPRKAGKGHPWWKYWLFNLHFSAGDTV